MDFVIVSGLFAVFLIGLVLAIQGVVGREIYPEGRPFGWSIDLDHPGIEHPPERHRVRLTLIGVGSMVVAVLLGILVL